MGVGVRVGARVRVGVRVRAGVRVRVRVRVRARACSTYLACPERECACMHVYMHMSMPIRSRRGMHTLGFVNVGLCRTMLAKMPSVMKAQKRECSP